MYVSTHFTSLTRKPWLVKRLIMCILIYSFLILLRMSTLFTFIRDIFSHVGSADMTLENNNVEGPWLIFRDPFYYLFYSGNGYLSPHDYTGIACSFLLTETL
jgi:hypothetical protein